MPSVLLPLLFRADTLVVFLPHHLKQSRRSNPLRVRLCETEFRACEKQNYGPRCDRTEQLSLQYGAKSVRKVLRAHPSALSTSCMVAGGIFSGFVLQPCHDQARGVAGFPPAERRKVVVLGRGSSRGHGLLRGVFAGSRAKAGSSQRIPP